MGFDLKPWRGRRAGSVAGPHLFQAGYFFPGLLDLGKLDRCALITCDGLTDASLDTLAKLRDLRNLEIKDCRNLTAAAITTFKKARTEVTVAR